MRVTDTCGFVCGDWQIQRSLTDYRTDTGGRFTGTASFTPVPGQPGTLRYREQGELCFGDHTGPARRELLWLSGPAGAADVRFADGRPFYPADFRTGRWHAVHRCGDDLYQVTYRIHAADLLTELWRVHGPGKDYLSATTLARAGTAAPLRSPASLDDGHTGPGSSH